MEKAKSDFTGFMISADLRGQVALFAHAIGSSKSAVMRMALREFLENPAKHQDMLSRELQRYRMRWELLKVKSAQKGGFNSNEMFVNFLKDCVADMRMYGISKEDVSWVKNRLRND